MSADDINDKLIVAVRECQTLQPFIGVECTPGIDAQIILGGTFTPQAIIKMAEVLKNNGD